MSRRARVWVAALVWAGAISVAWMAATGNAWAVSRFPPPDLPSQYQKPQAAPPLPRGWSFEYVDVAVLAGTLGLAAYLAVFRRSRNGLVALSVFSVAYFGFYRHGCVCAIGSIQNVALALTDWHYVIPGSVLIFFLLPLVTALFFGRAFCAGACPHGALQDLVLIRPIHLPPWLEQGLGVLPYVYLGLSVLYAATGSTFLICSYDPFVGFFRLGGPVNMLVFGAILLLTGMFIGRPYCRFLCPYGVVLRQLSRLSLWHLSIAPKECINCQLCEDACPFNAIHKPAPAAPPPGPRDRRRLAIAAIGLPVMMALGGLLVNRVSPYLALLHPTVQAAVAGVQGNASEADADGATSPETAAALAQQAQTVLHRFRIGGWILGAFLGLVIGGRLLKLAVFRQQKEYQADRAACVSCARCLMSCPRERARLGLPDGLTSTPQPVTVGVTAITDQRING